MHPITLPVSELKPALSGLSKVIVNKSTLLVLKTLKVERTPEGWICLTATDLDRFVTVRLEQPAKGEALSLLVPFEELSKFVKTASKGDQVHVLPNTEKEVFLRFNLGDQIGETKVPTCPVQEFPAIPRVQGKPVPVSESFRLALHDAMACASVDETRRILTGACLDVSQPKNHYLVGTDGRHLFSCNSFDLPFPKNLVIPKHKFLGFKDFNLDGAWQLRLSDVSDGKSQLLQISSRRWRFITKLIDGSYPNWRQVIPPPRDTHTTLTFDPDKLDALMPLIEKLPNHDEKHHSLGIEYQNKECRLLFKDDLTAPWTSVPLPHCKAEGKPVTVFLDRRHLLKALQFGLNTLGIIDATQAVRFHLGGRQMVMMPVRPNEPEEQGQKAPAPPSRDTPAPETLRPQPPSERKPHSMPNHSSPPPTASANPPEPPTTLLGQLQLVIGEVDIVGAQHYQVGKKLREVSTRLRSLVTSQKASDKEMRTLRQHLRGLQSMRI